ncbi:MAG: acc operon protein [Halobacteria archaeon]|nr:acc operon protein [Halobacteria archaeon]
MEQNDGFSLDIPDDANPHEVAAITAAISKHIADKRNEDGDDEEKVSPWTMSGRYSLVVDKKVRTPAGVRKQNLDGWTLSGRADRF